MSLEVTPTNPWSVIEAQFQNGTGRSYEYRSRLELTIGDVVVVHTANDDNLKVVQVVGVKPSTAQQFRGNLSWIICKVPMKEHLDLITEQAAIEAEEREIERLAIEARKIRAIEETFAGNPELKARFDALVARKKAL